jgi:RNA polymerase sigma-70 factor (ECF subfamily)
VAEREESLIEKAIAGDEGAFTQIYDKHFDRVFRYIYYRVGRTQDAEDLTQQVFLQAWKALGRFQQNGSPFLAWLLTIAHNLTVNHLQRNKTAHYLEYDLPERRPDADPEYMAEVHGEQLRVRQAVLKLKPDQQQVITMRYLENQEYRDIAAALGKTEVHVRVICHRALEKLRAILEREELECGGIPAKT